MRSIVATGLQQCAHLVMLVLIVLFSSSAFAYLYLGYWPVTHSDFWQIYKTGLDVPWTDLVFTKYNGHSSIFPAFSTLVDIYWFRGGQTPLFIGGSVLLIGTAATLLLPIWQSKDIDGASKLAATLIIMIGNFWMIRGEIIASGPFNVAMSLVALAAVAAVVGLPSLQRTDSQTRIGQVVVIAAGLVASFSFGGGMALWPTMLLLAWCLRLPAKAFYLMAGGGISTILIFFSLPPYGELGSSGVQVFAVSEPSIALTRLCQLVGAPLAHTIAAWHGHEVSAEFERGFSAAFWFGASGLTVAFLVISRQLILRNFRNVIEYFGIGLLVFIFCLCVLIVVGRLAHFRNIPSEVLAPRYLFWSTLFWTGVGLVLIGFVASKPRLRWLAFLVVLTIPIGIAPSHYREGAHFKYVRILATAGATSLINGVRDVGQVTILSIHQQDVFWAAKKMRARRLDMFAEGLQDYIGRPERELFNGRERSEGLKGECRVDALVPADDGIPAARIVGCCWTLKDGVTPPGTLVVVDPQGIVRGVARTASVSKMMNRIFYRDMFAPSYFVGYIRNYDVGLEYSVRSADNGALSTEKIIVQNANPTLTP